MNHKTINCPTCGKKNTWLLDNKFKPFCSDRCKLIDLGEWAKESRTIAGEEFVEGVEPQKFQDED